MSYIKLIGWVPFKAFAKPGLFLKKSETRSRTAWPPFTFLSIRVDVDTRTLQERFEPRNGLFVRSVSAQKSYFGEV